ncbi:hypothetical protein RGQ29_002928 [Quercus rubra]|uniref:Solute carrier family 35 member F1 n=1 Tax=Quercus rubra TaxID=3512 RepID=A0AAN7EAF4_QUERU|nr:hypothetical protein RGQ29_002928 [Quercus rubra]
MMSYKQFWTKKTLIGLGLGQFLSLLITSTGFTSSELAKRGINVPTSQSFLNYLLLAIVYGSIVIYRKKALKAKWYYYIPLGLVDVEANYLVVMAYQYTSMTSVMLLDCWSIPSVMVLTWFFLKTKYRFRKITGVIVCIAGLVLVVFSDVHAGDRAGGSNPRKGDAIVIAGATLYAVSNVSEEFLVKNADRVELMAMLGLFGAIVSAIQISIVERNALRSIHWTPGQINGSTMLNLSLLTSDMWSVVIRIFAYKEKVDWLYFVAFGAVTVGLIIYSGGDKDGNPRQAEVADEDAARNKCFDEEASTGSWNQGTVAGSSKTGESSNHAIAANGVAEREVVENKNIGKDAQGKIS